MIIEKLLKEQYGFITNKKELFDVIEENRLAPVLVRCNNGRFICPAQDVENFTEMVDESESNYVRDISLVKKYNFNSY